MKKKLFLLIFIIISSMIFCETKEFIDDLNSDGIKDIFIVDSSHNFDYENDQMNVDVKISIKLMNADGTIKNEVTFTENRVFYDDEYDGGLSYYVENNIIVRNLIVGRHSYKNYIDLFYIYDEKLENWIMYKKRKLISPMHENILTEDNFNNCEFVLYNKQTLEYSGPDQ